MRALETTLDYMRFMWADAARIQNINSQILTGIQFFRILNPSREVISSSQAGWFSGNS